MKIQRNDLKILAALDKDSRAQFSDIAKSTGIGQESVRYRFNRLAEEGVITRCTTLINATALGYTYYQLLFKLQNVDIERRAALLSFLKEHPRIGWVAEIEGIYDIAIITPVRHQPELQRLIDDIYGRFSGNIMRRTLSVNLSGEFFPRDYLLSTPRAMPRHPPAYAYEEQHDITDKEKHLCRILAADSRTTAVEAGQRLGVSTDTVLRMMRALTRKRIILQHALTIDPTALARSHYKILLYLNNIDSKTVEQLRTHVRLDNRSLAIIRSLSEYDYELDYELEGPEQLKEVTMELTNTFSNIIRDYSVLRITAMPKYTFFP